jgi:hypothetical protein
VPSRPPSWRPASRPAPRTPRLARTGGAAAITAAARSRPGVVGGLALGALAATAARPAYAYPAYGYGYGGYYPSTYYSYGYNPGYYRSGYYGGYARDYYAPVGVAGSYYGAYAPGPACFWTRRRIAVDPYTVVVRRVRVCE